jgi:hypothetical protein
MTEAAMNVSLKANTHSLLLTTVLLAGFAGQTLLTARDLNPAASPSGCVATPSGLVSWWRAETNALDAVGGNNGTLLNGVSYAPGEVGQAFSFNGTNSYVEVPDSAALRLTNELTIEFWLKRQTLTPPAPEYFIEKGGDYTGGSQNYAVAVGSPTINNFLHFTCAGAWWGTEPINDLNWHHYAVTARNGQSAPQIYVDGGLQVLTAHGGASRINLYPSTRPLHIGAQVDPVTGWYYYSKTLIDEVGLYNRVLTGVEIQAIYNAGNAGKCIASPPSACASPPSDLVSWWRAEGDAGDSAGSNNGALINGASFATGSVGQAFSFNGTNSYVEVPDSPGLRLTNALTIEFWLKRQTLTPPTPEYFVEKGGDYTGGRQNYAVAVGSPTINNFLHFTCAGAWWGAAPISDLNWHHYAVTARNGQSAPQIYVDGALQVLTAHGGASQINLYPSTRPLHIGAQVDPVTGWNYYSKTLIDELSLYSRVLTTSEIQAIYNAGSAGKCGPGITPSIVSQPADQSVPAGGTAAFNVVASGSAPLSYQWRFQGADLPGATTTSFTLAGAQLTNAGNYSVLVSNLAGSTLSSNALLTVLSPPNCSVAPPGLVSWWRAETNALDAIDGNHGTLHNGVGFAPGEVGQAFSFNGTDGYVEVPDSPALQLTNELTIEFWLKRQTLTPPTPEYFIEKGGDYTGGAQNYGVAVGSSTINNFLHFTCAGAWWGAAPISDLNWHHYAVTARNGQSAPQIYVDGALQVLTAHGGASQINLYPSTRPLHIGAQVDPVTGWYYYSKTLIDELSLYKRVLAASEIQAIYSAGLSGKCATTSAPSILTQPTNQTVTIGASVSFTVAAGGTPPLCYQWQFNGTNIGGATGSVLVLTNVQVVQAGNYAVQVTNAYGSTNSANAVLTVNQAPPCVTPPAGLVSWWQAEGNAVDASGSNNGVLLNGVGFAPGEVGQAFSFKGTNSYVEVPDSPALQLTNELTIEFWLQRQTLTPATPEYFVEKGGDYTGGVQNYAVSVGSPTINNFLCFTCAGAWWGAEPINDLNWHHYAVTARNGQSAPQIYVDGVLQVLTHHGGASQINLHLNTRPLHIGAQVDPVTGWYYYSKTLIDELGLYNRVLTGVEIQNLYNAGSAGKCPEPPSILVQPASQMVTASSNASFCVTATGTPLLCYQWRFNGTNITGATASSLSLANVQTGNAGAYSVRIANAFGSVISSDAVLAVNQVPVAQCTDVIVAAGTNCQADASVNNGSFDPDGDPITVSQSPPGPYPLGTNRVTLTVTDNQGVCSSCSALVIVLDQTAPVVSCPDGKVLEFQDETGAVASYSVTATDTCTAAILLLTPPSDSLFPIGTTPVSVQATDGSGNQAQCDFTVTVVGAQGVKSNLLAELTVLRAGGNLSQTFAQQFDDAIQHLGSSLDPAYWVDQTHLVPKGGNAAMNEEKLAAKTLADILDAKGCPIAPAILQGLIDRIVRCDRLLAVICIQEAAAGGLSPRKVAEDLALVAKGDAEAEKGHCANAIEHYRNAWRHALQLRLQVSLNPDGTTLVQFVGNNSKSYRIEMSTDMVNWVSLGACTADSDGNVEFADPNSAAQPLRFYRAVEQ